MIVAVIDRKVEIHIKGDDERLVKSSWLGQLFHD